MLNTKLTKSILRTTDKYIEALSKVSVNTIWDFINHFPRDYDDRTEVIDSFSLINIKEKNTVLVSLVSINDSRTSNNMILTKAIIEDKNWFLSEAVWFNRKYLSNQLKLYIWKKIILTSKVKYSFWKISFQSPEVETDLSKIWWEIVPIYPDLNYIPSKWIEWKMSLLKTYFSEISEILPEKIIKKYNFISRKEAFYLIHFPKNKNDIEVWRFRLWYEELFNINYKTISKKYESFSNSKWKSVVIKLNPNLIKYIISKLKFELTDNQKIVLFQILKDMEKEHSMSRLLEWDVWTWKTIVALIVSIHAILETLPEYNRYNQDKGSWPLGKSCLTESNPQPPKTHPQPSSDIPHPQPLSFGGEGSRTFSTSIASFLEDRNLEHTSLSSLQNLFTDKNNIWKTYLKSPAYVFDLAKKFRKYPTEPEKKLWLYLRNNKFDDLKFRRQHPVWRYIADFCCEELKLIVEIDWKIHDSKFQKEYEEERDNLLKNYWFNIVRLKNEDILYNDKESIYLKIKKSVLSQFSFPSPSKERVRVRSVQKDWILDFGEGSRTFSNPIQTVFIAPTEILAYQHFQSSQELLNTFWITSYLLTGSTTQKQKMEIKDWMKNGDVDIIFGTHALLQDDILFKNLWFVIIDEQHRFWVKQREILEAGFWNISGMIPHSLNMTATPIPRTLALTLYWDQDLSIINKYPKWRKEIFTKVVKNEKERKQVELFIKNELDKGRQIFWISPLVEESEKIDLANAINTHSYLENIFFPYKVWLLHGKMKPKEKEEIMLSFKKNYINVLSSTSVVEVWVDIANASVICIEWAERFGLSQLHQFRWRVGRGDYKSYCYLFPSSWNYTDRLKAMEKTNNGFELSEIDLEIRWPWEVYWVRQSWLPDLKIAKLTDLELISEIREDIEDLMLNGE